MYFDQISSSGDADRPFQVDGDTFTDFQSAADRACDNQKNNCADMANSGQGNFEVGDCDKQNGEFSIALKRSLCFGDGGARKLVLWKVVSRDVNRYSISGQCKATAQTATQTAFQELVSSNAEFDFICDVS